MYNLTFTEQLHRHVCTVALLAYKSANNNNNNNNINNSRNSNNSSRLLQMNYLVMLDFLCEAVEYLSCL